MTTSLDNKVDKLEESMAYDRNQTEPTSKEKHTGALSRSTKTKKRARKTQKVQINFQVILAVLAVALILIRSMGKKRKNMTDTYTTAAVERRTSPKPSAGAVIWNLPTPTR